MVNKDYLLIISCSKSKKETDSKIPAIELYKGPYYQIIRKMKREDKFPRNLEIRILSAKHGLIKPNMEIGHYDQKMDEERAKELNGKVEDKLNDLISRRNYKKIILNLGKDYMKALGSFETQESDLEVIEGQIGERMHKMKSILEKLGN